MQTVIRERTGEFRDGLEIVSIDGLENSDLVELERGNILCKLMKKTVPVNGRKNTYSVKMIREAVSTAERKQVSRRTVHYCNVCGQYVSNGSDGLCSECRI